MEAPPIAEEIAYENAIACSIFDMNVKEARKQRLGQLKEEHGTLREVAARIIAHSQSKGKKLSPKKGKYLDRYLSQIHNGTRGMGHKMARQIEGAFGKRDGWMDHMGTSSLEAGELLKIWGQFPEEEQARVIEELRIRLRVIKDRPYVERHEGDTPRPPKRPQ